MKPALLIIFICAISIANAKEFQIYLDADFSGLDESTKSVRKGLELALRETNYKIGEHTLVIIDKDHKKNTRRSKGHIKHFIDNPLGLIMFSGAHSPPLISNRDFINENEVPFLVPWAAGGPITRAKTDKNFIFRLSIDDTKAGGYLASYALEKGYKKPCLLLEETGWGDSNLRNITKGFEQNNVSVHKVYRFKWGIKKVSASNIAHKIHDSRCGVVILVGSYVEGAELVRELASFRDGETTPIISHWGIVSGNFEQTVPFDIREKVKLRFIQTKFSFFDKKMSKFQKTILNDIIKSNDDINTPYDIKAPTGIIHAYDLAKIFITALKEVNLDQDIKQVRRDIKNKLENLDTPVQGLLKNYNRPFSPYKVVGSDAHEALSEKEYSMGYFGPQGEIKLK